MNEPLTNNGMSESENELVEDFIDFLIIKSRESEKTVSWDEVKKQIIATT